MGLIGKPNKMPEKSYSTNGDNVHYLNVESSVKSANLLKCGEKSDKTLNMENRITKLEVNADHTARILAEIKQNQKSDFRWILGILIAILLGMYSSYQNLVNLIMSLKH